MQEPDSVGTQVLERLHSTFPELHNRTTSSKSFHCAPGVLVGFEIEVPWRAYFPNLWRKYFQNGSRSYKDMTPHEQAALTEDCSQLETSLLPRLEKTIACGIPRGSDRYWEFALPPTQDLGIALRIIETLHKASLLPWGSHSLQATVSGLRDARNACTFLCMLELLFVPKERILKPLRGFSTWARRGTGGIYHKGGGRLLYATHAFELRTLQLPSTIAQCDTLLKHMAILSFLFTEHTDPKTQQQALRIVKEITLQFGIPYRLWGSPFEDSGVWERYVQSYDSMRDILRTRLQREIGVSI